MGNDLIIRTLNRCRRPDRPPKVRCQSSGCTRATTDEKPFCSDHVTDNDYATDLLKRIAEQ